MNYLLEINPEKIAEFDKQPHEPLSFSDSESIEKFEDEYSGVLDNLVNELDRLGYHRSPSGYGGDYYISDDHGPFRLIYVVILNPKMISRKLVDCIVSYIKGLDTEYMISVSNEFEQDLQVFNVVLTLEKGYGEFETGKIAEAFGFDPNSDLIGPIV